MFMAACLPYLFFIFAAYAAEEDTPLHTFGAGDPALLKSIRRNPNDLALLYTFGTHDKEALKEISKKPFKHWKISGNLLEKKLISHEDFCQEYIKKAEALFLRASGERESLPETCSKRTILDKDRNEKTKNPWFINDLGAVDHILQEQGVAPHHPSYLNAKMFCCARVCRILNSLNVRDNAHIPNQHAFSAELDTWLSDHVPHEDSALVAKRKWILTPEGTLSQWESLALLEKGYFVCAAKSFPKVENSRGCPLDQSTKVLACNGVAAIRFLEQSQDQRFYEKSLEEKHISPRELLLHCFGKHNLVTRDTRALARQTNAVYCQFVAMKITARFPSEKVLILPKITDREGLLLRQTAPYFFTQQDLKLSKHFISDENIAEALSRWRDRYCQLDKKCTEVEKKRSEPSFGFFTICFFGVCLSCIPCCGP